MVDDRFAVIIPHSIRRYSEARGFEILNDEIADALAEDASYRLREAISLSAQYMKRSRRSTLKPEDVIKALEIYNAPQMIGVERENKPGRMPLEEDIHYLGDDHISIHVSSCLATHDTKNGEASHQVMISKWVRLNGGRFSAEKSLAEIALPDARLDYFTSLVSCILSDNWYHRRESFNDLQENSNISQLIPYFANFALNVKAVSHDICQLSMLLQTVSALISNSNLCLLGYLKSLASSVLYCVLEPLAASINPVNDHWRLRDYGSRILSHMALKHGPKNKDFTCYLCNSVQAFLWILRDLYVPTMELL